MPHRPVVYSPPPPIPPGVRFPFPSGSKFAEDEVSAILSSEAGSEVISSIRPVGWRTFRIPSKLRKSPPKTPASLYSESESETLSTRSSSTAILPPTVSFVTSVFPAESFTEDDRLGIRSHENPFFLLLSRVAPEESPNCLSLLQTSLSYDRDMIRDIIPQKNGFVKTVLEAYNNHRGLIIRPDDVWLAILLQFSAFRNSGRVDNDEFTIHLEDNHLVANPSMMADQMLNLVREKMPSWEQQEWIASSFTTSTNVDTTACAMAMLGTVEWEWEDHPFTLQPNNVGGIARVKLEGTRRDWENIVMRLEKLREYGIPAIAWHHLLHPVISRFVATYDNPNSPENLEFWNRVIVYDDVVQSPRMSGWLTAFCVFGDHGEWQGNTLNEDRIREHEPKKLLRPANPLHLSPSRFASVYTHRDRNPRLVMDGFPFPIIDIRTIPRGLAHLELKMMDKGDLVNVELVAGSVGSLICSTDKSELFRNGMRDTVRPVTAWWFFKTYSRRQRSHLF